MDLGRDYSVDVCHMDLLIVLEAVRKAQIARRCKKGASCWFCTPDGAWYSHPAEANLSRQQVWIQNKINSTKMQSDIRAVC